jgi:hypothetical protein
MLALQRDTGIRWIREMDRHPRTAISQQQRIDKQIQ